MGGSVQDVFQTGGSFTLHKPRIYPPKLDKKALCSKNANVSATNRNQAACRTNRQDVDQCNIPPRLEINGKTIEKTWKLMDKVVKLCRKYQIKFMIFSRKTTSRKSCTARGHTLVLSKIWTYQHDYIYVCYWKAIQI